MKITHLGLTSCLLVLLLSARPDASAEKSLLRIQDPVVIQGADLQLLIGSHPGELSLMSRRGGQWSAIPFQFDQKKPDGEYAFTSGPGASMDPDINLDANDEVVFLARDTGDQVSGLVGGPWPAGAVAGMEIEVEDPNDGSRGWVYLFRFQRDPPKSPVDYIRLEIDQDLGRRLVTSDLLVVGSPIDKVYPDMIAQVDPATGQAGKDVLDRLKIRGELVFPGDIKIPFSADELIKCRDTGYKDGPIRVLHQASGFMEVSGIELKGFGHSTLFYYPNHIIVPVTIQLDSQVPEWLKRFIPKGRVAGYMDFNPNIYGSYVISEANPFNPEVVLDGKMSEAEKNLDRETEIDWIGGFGPAGGLVVRLILDEETRAHSKMVTYFVDDDKGKDEPEDNPGTSMAGFEITGRDGSMENFTGGATFQVHAYAKHDLSPDNVHAVLDVLDHPLLIKTRGLEIGPNLQ